MTTKLRVQFDGKALIPLEPVDFPTGQVFDIEVRESQPPQDDANRRGSPRAILEALQAVPPLSAEAAAEFERVLREADEEQRLCQKCRSPRY
jgi:hypothetical protein